MRVHVGADHGGYAQKTFLVEELRKAGYEVTDHGTTSSDIPDDYPDFARPVGEAVAADKGALGVLLCRSGEGMEMAANKIDGIRAALVWKKEVAEETRKDNDANVVVVPSDFVSNEEAREMVLTFLETPFSHEERHQRRIDKIESMEEDVHAS